MQLEESDVLDVALGERIRLRRRQLGISQTALGQSLGVSFQQIQKYERGANRVSFSSLVRIAQTLECRIADLIGDLDDPATPNVEVPVRIAPIGPGGAALLTAFQRIRSPYVRKTILDLTETLAPPDEERVSKP